MVTGRKLLLADDSVTIQKVIDLTFSDEGIEVTTVGNGEQAISKLEEIQPDIVLADIFMPGRNGYEVCEHIKRDERFRHIPVMLLVGSFEPFDEAEARRVGADDYLTKPFQSIRQLVSKVTSLLGGGRGDEAPTRDLNPDELDQKQFGSESAADIHTADTAPLPRELAGKEPAEVAAHLAGHESLDDEMIEAHQASEFESPRETLGAGDARPTAPLSVVDLEETGLKTAAGASPESFQETMRDFELDEMDKEGQARTPARFMNNAAAADEALLDLGDIEPPTQTTEADDFILDLQDDDVGFAPQPKPVETNFAQSESAQPAFEAASVSAHTDFAQAAQAAAPPPQHDFVEEMQSPATFEPPQTEAAEAATTTSSSAEAQTPVEAASAEAFSLEEASGPQAYEPQPSSESLQATAGLMADEGASLETSAAVVETEEPGTEAATPAAPQAGQITLEQLSPEAIDAIARRAVELLSTRVVEEIAWEVVPHMAELLIKRKLEEEKT